MTDDSLMPSGKPGSLTKNLPKPKHFADYLAPGAPRTSLSQLNEERKAVPIVSVLFDGLARVSGIQADERSVVLIAKAFVEDLPGYPLEDIILFLRKVSRGEFGKLYGKLSLPDLMDMWRQYDQQRLAYLRDQHERRKAECDGQSMVTGLGTFHSPAKRQDLDNRPRTKQSMEWVLTELYGIPVERVREILAKKEG